MDEVSKLLVPVVSCSRQCFPPLLNYVFLLKVDGEDELKKRQLMELAIINGTYRDSNTRNGKSPKPWDRYDPTEYWITKEDFRMMTGLENGDSSTQHSQQLMHSPVIHQMRQPVGAPLIISPRHLMTQHLLNGNGHPPLIPAENGLLYAPYDAFHHYALQHQHHLMEYPNTTGAGSPMSDSLSANGALLSLAR